MERRESSEMVGGGVGGKLTTTRRGRAQSTPYDRPPRQQRKEKNGLLSKLLLRPAFRIFPSVFSNRQCPLPSPPLSDSEQEDGVVLSKPISDNQSLELKEVGVSAENGQPKVSSKADELVGGNAYDDCVLAEIEQSLKKRTFTRDESNHLIELLQSRMIDLQNDVGCAADHAIGAADGTSGQKVPGISAKEGLDMQSDCRLTWMTSDPFQFTPCGVSSSPIEIAKSYMEAQTSPYVHNFPSERLKIEKSSLYKDNSASRSPFTSVVRPPICWPGAVVQEDQKYFTSQRRNIGLHDYPRTPYSGSVFPKSTCKPQGSEEEPKCSSAKRKQLFTDVFGGNMMKRRSSSVLEDGFSSFDSVRHVQWKDMANSSNVVGSSNLTSFFTPLSNSSDVLNEFSSSIQGNIKLDSPRDNFCMLQPAGGGDQASRRSPHPFNVHPQSSETARKILEHLNRTVPFPKEKSLELKLATARRMVSPETTVINGQDSGFNLNSSNDPKNGSVFGKNVVIQESADAEKILQGPGTSKLNDKGRLSSLASTSKQGTAELIHGAFENAAAFHVPSIQPRPSHGSVSTSIYTLKPSGKTEGCENGFNFSFTVHKGSDTFSVPPPTPTMTTSPSTSKMPEAREGSIPSFNFGSNRADSRLVFSFGSTISSSPSTDVTATPTFKFGSRKMHSLPVKPTSKGTICC